MLGRLWVTAPKPFADWCVLDARIEETLEKIALHPGREWHFAPGTAILRPTRLHERPALGTVHRRPRHAVMIGRVHGRPSVGPPERPQRRRLGCAKSPLRIRSSPVDFRESRQGVTERSISGECDYVSTVELNQGSQEAGKVGPLLAQRSGVEPPHDVAAGIISLESDRR